MLSLLLSACANTTHRAPIEERVPQLKPLSRTPAPAVVAPLGAKPAQPVVEAPALKPLPGAENAGKPGYYIVKPGDTLIRISLDHGQNWRDVARWSQLDNPNAIEVGQVLRMVPPVADPTVVVARPVAPAGRMDGRPLEGAAVAVAVPSTATGATGAAPVPAPATGAALPATSIKEFDEEIQWAWPSTGPVTAPFDDIKSKGLVFAGRAGDPVLAAADGRVVYAGSSLRGYGNLVIVKHNAVFLTAYAHNQTLLVKDEQVVRKGQKIAEMGSTDADRVQLHFEIRRGGKPVDPARLLPTR